jgi:hypothetical protein
MLENVAPALRSCVSRLAPDTDDASSVSATLDRLQRVHVIDVSHLVRGQLFEITQPARARCTALRTFVGMNNHNSNTHVPTTGSPKAAPTPMSECDPVLSALEGRWLDQLTASEIEFLVERRASRLRSMLSASAKADVRYAIGGLDAASSSHPDGVGRLPVAVEPQRRAFPQRPLSATSRDSAWEVEHREECVYCDMPVTGKPIRQSVPAPSIEELKALRSHLKASHPESVRIVVALIAGRGLRFGESLALRFDSFWRDADGSWLVNVGFNLRDGMHGQAEMIPNMAVRTVRVPAPLAERLEVLFGDRLGRSAEFVFADEGRNEPSARRVEAMLTSAMRRAGWSEALLRSPGRALRAAWRAHGEELAGVLWPNGDHENDELPSID